MPGEIGRILPVLWTSDQGEVVLEAPDEKGTGTVDTSKTTWRGLLQELEESGATDPTINSHEVLAPAAAVDEGTVATTII